MAPMRLPRIFGHMGPMADTADQPESDRPEVSAEVVRWVELKRPPALRHWLLEDDFGR